MIKTGLLVPSNYYTRSRDFQMIGRVMDLVFNSSKSYSDMVQHNAICKNTDKRLLDLIAKTVGFEVKRQYDSVDLFVLCSVFRYILRRKGTKGAVEDCVSVLLKAQNIDKPFFVYDDGADLEYQSNTKRYHLSIFVPEEMSDIALLEDMLDYVMPAGYTYGIISTVETVGGISENVVAFADSVNSYEVTTQKLGQVYNPTGETLGMRADMTVAYRDDD